MNEAPQLDIVELGDAKDATKGLPVGPKPEANEDLPFRLI